MSDWTPSPDLLEDLAMALRLDGDEVHAWFDTLDRTIVFEEGVDIDTTDDRYRRIEPLMVQGRLTAFIQSVDDPALREALWKAERGGRGAYRRVRGVLRRRGQEQLWFDFEAAADRELALDWLRDEDLL